MSMKHNFSEIEISRVYEVITSRIGLYFPIERHAMLRRNLTAAGIEFGYDNLTDFVQMLLSTILDKEQMQILASHLTISETYFWREPKVFEAFSETVINELITSKSEAEKTINIWCAGCSTGEEAYSIAIALHRTIPQIKNWKINILATDINIKALCKARKGIYNMWSFRNSPHWLMSRYFKTINNQEYEIIPEIKDMVTFSAFNLTNDNFLNSVCKNNKMDIIFCRNVLMYFTSNWISRISQNLFQCLHKDGWLVVSSCELSPELFRQYTPVNFPGAVLYRKTKKNFKGISNNSDNSINQKNTNTLTSSNIEITEHADFEFDLLSITKTSTQTTPLIEYLDLTKEDVNTQNSILIENINSIRILANQGHLVEALSVCDATIESNKLASKLYFLRASILQELNKSREAIDSLKQAIYIDPNYIMGHFTLGNLFISLGIYKNAKQHFNNALEILNSIADDDIFAESEGLSPKYIREIIINNLQIQPTK